MRGNLISNIAGQGFLGTEQRSLFPARGQILISSICNKFYTSSSVLSLILLMCRGLVVESAEQVGIVNFAIDV